MIKTDAERIADLERLVAEIDKERLETREAFLSIAKWVKALGANDIIVVETAILLHSPEREKFERAQAHIDYLTRFVDEMKEKIRDE